MPRLICNAQIDLNCSINFVGWHGQPIKRDISEGIKMKAQLVGNVGLYEVCAELSRKGFNVMPTARNAKGVDIVGYDDNGKAFTVQVKTLTKRNAIPLGGGANHLMADYFVVVVLEGKWEEIYVWTRKEMRNAQISAFTGKDGKTQHWFESKVWTQDTAAFAANGAWEKIMAGVIA